MGSIFLAPSVIFHPEIHYHVKCLNILVHISFSNSSISQYLHLLLKKPNNNEREREVGFSYLLGTPDTSRKGRNTRKARSALTSNPAPLPPIEFTPSALVACSKIALKSLGWKKMERGNKWLVDSMDKNKRKKIYCSFLIYCIYCKEHKRKMGGGWICL